MSLLNKLVFLQLSLLVSLAMLQISSDLAQIAKQFLLHSCHFYPQQQSLSQLPCCSGLLLVSSDNSSNVGYQSLLLSCTNNFGQQYSITGFLRTFRSPSAYTIPSQPFLLVADKLQGFPCMAARQLQMSLFQSPLQGFIVQNSARNLTPV